MTGRTAPVLTGPEKGSEWTTDRREVYIPFMRPIRVMEPDGEIEAREPWVYVYRLEHFYFIDKEDGFRNFQAWVLADVREA